MNPLPNPPSTNQPPLAPPPNFNPLARLYRWLEWITFGPCLARARFAFLPETGNATKALIIGDGDGRFTARLLRTNPSIQIDAVDSSSAMLQALHRRAAPSSARVHIHLADARQFQPPNPPYGLIVTHFFLDCLTTAEIQSLAATLRTAAHPQVLWIVSEFCIPSSWYGKFVARPLVYSLYRAFALLTGLTVRALPDHRYALRQSGFFLQHQRSRLAGLLVSELWSLTPLQTPDCYSRVKIASLAATRNPQESPPDRSP